MSPDVTERGTDCTTTASFADHGVEDGQRFIRRTYARLGEDPTFEPTEAFFDRLATAFRWAALATFDTADVPDHVEAAIDDARVFTAREFADDPDADLRTEVVPAFYQRAAGFHCAYR